MEHDLGMEYNFRMDWETLEQHWRRGAMEDIDAARILIDKRKLWQGLFFVHLALEKALKSRVIGFTHDSAPKIHNLVRLAELAGMDLTADQKEVLAEYNQYCAQGRYFDSAPLKISAQDALAVLD